MTMLKERLSERPRYRPPPEFDLGKLVEDSINRNRGRSEEELKKPLLEGRDSGDSVKIPSDYLREVEVKEAKEIKKSPLGVAVHFRFVGLGERRASQKEF